MIVKQFVIHRLEKEAHKSAKLTKRADPSKITDKVVSFSVEIRKAYYGSGVKFGAFDPNTTTFPYQVRLREYLDGKENFISFTHTAAEHLQVLANRESLARGGYLVFSHYEDEDEFFSVMLLNDKTGHAIDKHLDLVTLVHLEIEKVHVASAVNITRWNSGLEPYLSFVEGSRELAKYFLDFIGCTTVTSSLQQSRGLSKAVRDYLQSKGVCGDDLDAKLQQIYDYCESQVRQKQPVHLPAIAAMVEPQNPKDFSIFARQPDYSVDESFQGNLRALRAMTRISYSGTDLRISFDHSLITTGRIIYDDKKNALTIKEVPEGLRKQLAPDAA